MFFEKVQPAGSPTYFIDHMSFTFLIDGEGKFVGALPRGTAPDRMEPVVREMTPLKQVEKKRAENSK